MFGEPSADVLVATLEACETLLSSNLLEAELRSALSREGVDDDDALVGALTWVLPDRPLGPEIGRALRAGRARGADLWHLATALFVSETPSDLPFLTLDARQGEVAHAIGFPTPLQDAAIRP